MPAAFEAGDLGRDAEVVKANRRANLERLLRYAEAG
jgi:hypothetical protein